MNEFLKFTHDHRKAIYAAMIGVVALIIIAWYNSPAQQMKRCVESERSRYWSTSEAQRLKNEGADPGDYLFIMQCKQYGYH
ncbi:hypothetical protein AWB91_08975 [Mycobacterium paraense]|uniref:Phage protein n=1 Tax=Mycobacterium paraense TaxID=767916 RepID=A0ABX3VS31_9MYCO|nr:hypothetical protein [Mycobacterium paraense]ORW33249.1 hypothetical protein AWB91_08975 [Mycobacterium paraense]ORW34691.1 hypothetical protein AWB88_02805 [Mycobacterium paraense]